MSWSGDGTQLAFITLIEDESRSSEIIVMDVVQTLESEQPITMQISDFPADVTLYGISWRPKSISTLD